MESLFFLFYMESLNLCFIVATFDSPPRDIALFKQAATDLMFSLVVDNFLVS